MSRSALNELILPNEHNDHRPPVRSFVLRKKGAKSGIRLIDYASLRAYIRSNESLNSGADHSESLPGCMTKI